MSSEHNESVSETTEKGTVTTNKKLPYVKPELHLLNLDGTEGKVAKTFETTSPTLGATTKYGPS